MVDRNYEIHRFTQECIVLMLRLSTQLVLFVKLFMYSDVPEMSSGCPVTRSLSPEYLTVLFVVAQATALIPKLNVPHLQISTCCPDSLGARLKINSSIVSRASH